MRLWSVLALIPLVSAFVERDLPVATLLAVLLVAGATLSRLARRLDPAGAVLEGLARAPAAQTALLGLVLLLPALGAAASWGLAAAASLAAGLVLLVLWLRAATARALRESLGRAVLMSLSIGVALAVGEAFLRVPAVVARTGGNTPGMIRWGRHYDRLEETNPLGLRSFHLGPKAPGTFRIVALGDSFTHGDAVARTQDLWPYVLERRLYGRGRRVEAVNLGRGGFTTVNEAEMLDTLGWLFEPDLVIVQYTLNDPLPSEAGGRHRHESWLFPTWPLVPRLHESLDAHSYLYSFVNHRFWALQVRWRYPRGYAPLFDDQFHGWRESRQALERMAGAARRRGVPLLVVLFPLFTAEGLEDARYPYAPLHDKVRAAAVATGLPLLDLRPLYAARVGDGRAWWALPCDWHPGVEAHRLAGEAVADQVLGAGWIRTDAPPPSLDAGRMQ